MSEMFILLSLLKDVNEMPVEQILSIQFPLL